MLFFFGRAPHFFENGLAGHVQKLVRRLSKGHLRRKRSTHGAGPAPIGLECRLFDAITFNFRKISMVSPQGPVTRAYPSGFASAPR